MMIGSSAVVYVRPLSGPCNAWRVGTAYIPLTNWLQIQATPIRHAGKKANAQASMQDRPFALRRPYSQLEPIGVPTMISFWPAHVNECATAPGKSPHNVTGNRVSDVSLPASVSYAWVSVVHPCALVRPMYEPRGKQPQRPCDTATQAVGYRAIYARPVAPISAGVRR